MSEHEASFHFLYVWCMSSPEDGSKHQERQNLFLKEKVELEQKLLIPEWGESTRNKVKVTTSSDVVAVGAASQTDKPFAGFFWRALAHIIDDTLFGWAFTGFIAVYGCSSVLLLHFLPKMAGAGLDDSAFASAITALGIMFCFSAVIFGWIYFAGFESSDMEATPGKRMLGMKVCDLNEHRFTFAKATGKLLIQPGIWVAIMLVFATIFIVTMVPAPFAIIGYTLIFVTIIALIFVSCFGNLFFINKRNQTIIDFLGKRLVLKPETAVTEPSRARIKLLPFEKKVIAAVFASLVLLMVEVGAVALFNVDVNTCVQFPLGAHALNKSGMVMRTKKDLKAGTFLTPDMYEAPAPESIFTPPFAIEPDAKLGSAVLCRDLAKGKILTYLQVIPDTKSIRNIISIEAIPEKDFALSRCTVVAQSDKTIPQLIDSIGGSPEKDFNTRSVLIQRLLTDSRTDNQRKQFTKALSETNQAINSLVELNQKANSVYEEKTIRLFKKMDGALIKSKTAFSAKDLRALPDWLRAVVTDIIIQRSIARAGLHQGEQAAVDENNCLLLLNSMHENFVKTRSGDFNNQPVTDEQTASSDTGDAEVGKRTSQYLKMLVASDEKRYQTFITHFKKIRSNSR